MIILYLCKILRLFNDIFNFYLWQKVSYKHCGGNSHCKHYNMWQISHWNWFAFSHQCCQEGCLFWWVWWVSRSVEESWGCLWIDSLIGIVNPNLRCQFFTNYIKVLDQTSLFVCKRIKRKFTMIGSHSTLSNSTKW